MIKKMLSNFVDLFKWPVLKLNGFIELEYINNPFASGSLRNNICVCGSGKKMKHCHGQEKIITVKEATEIYKMATHKIREEKCKTTTGILKE